MQIPAISHRKRPATPAETSPEPHHRQETKTDSPPQTALSSTENTPTPTALVPIPAQNSTSPAPGMDRISLLPAELRTLVLESPPLLSVVRMRRVSHAFHKQINAAFVRRLVAIEQDRLISAVEMLDGLQDLPFLDAVSRFDAYSGLYDDYCAFKALEMEWLSALREVEKKTRAFTRVWSKGSGSVRGRSDDATASTPIFCTAVRSERVLVDAIFTMFDLQRCSRPSSDGLGFDAQNLRDELEREESAISKVHTAFSGARGTRRLCDKQVVMLIQRVREERPFGRRSETDSRVARADQMGQVIQMDGTGDCRRCHSDLELPHQLWTVGPPGLFKIMMRAGKAKEMVRRHPGTCLPVRGGQGEVDFLLRRAMVLEDVFVWC